MAYSPVTHQSYLMTCGPATTDVWAEAKRCVGTNAHGTLLVVYIDEVSRCGFPDRRRSIGRDVSLRKTSDEGNPIYAIYRVAGRSESAVCDAVRGAGDGAHGSGSTQVTARSTRFVARQRSVMRKDRRVKPTAASIWQSFVS